MSFFCFVFLLFLSRSTVAPQLFFSEIAGFETNAWPYLLEYGVPCHPDVIVRYSVANKKMHADFLFIASLFVSSSHETLVKENRWFMRGAIVESLYFVFHITFYFPASGQVVSFLLPPPGACLGFGRTEGPALPTLYRFSPSFATVPHALALPAGQFLRRKKKSTVINTSMQSGGLEPARSTTVATMLSTDSTIAPPESSDFL